MEMFAIENKDLSEEEVIFLHVISVLREKINELESDHNYKRISEEEYERKGKEIEWEEFRLEYEFSKFYGFHQFC